MGFRAENYIKTREELDSMRKAGKLLSTVLKSLKNMLKPGLDVWELEKAFTSFCGNNKLTPSCKGYNPFGTMPFPTGLCVSINSQSVHCFPKKGVKLKDGDIITIDTVVKYKNMHVDSAFAATVGESGLKAQKLVQTAERALYNAINEVKDNTRIGKLSGKLQKTAEKAGFNVIREYAGHGIGSEMHEWPQILCYGNKNDGPNLKTGMTVCVESLCCSGNYKVENLSLWETKMKDNGLFAQFEHTVLVLDNGYEILTQ
jgi:methionyl aminopeptidase